MVLIIVVIRRVKFVRVVVFRRNALVDFILLVRPQVVELFVWVWKCLREKTIAIVRRILPSEGIVTSHSPLMLVLFKSFVSARLDLGFPFEGEERGGEADKPDGLGTGPPLLTSRIATAKGHVFE